MRKFFSGIPKRYSFYFYSILFAFSVNGQSLLDTKKISHNTFISDKLEYLDFIDDSTLNTSLGFFGDTATYYFKGDSLTANRYKQCGNSTYVPCWSKYYSAKIIILRSDSIVLVNPCFLSKKPEGWEDTLFFTNLELLKEPVVNFKYLSYSYKTWGWIDKLVIDSSSKVTFTRIPVDRSRTDSVRHLYSKQKKSGNNYLLFNLKNLKLFYQNHSYQNFP